jgi:hypothetical protein
MEMTKNGQVELDGVIIPYYQEGGEKTYIPTVCGVGYIGDGKYKVSVNRKHTEEYDRWKGILRRCYNEEERYKNPTYKDVTVCEEWLNFQNFAEWWDKNYYKIDGEKMQLDKDILIKGNKLYSPSTCIFVPQNINILFTKCHKVREGLPMGINFDSKRNKYRAYCSIKGKLIAIGNSYNTSEDAFYLGYKPFKENIIKQKADEYKDRIPNNLYNAMINWKVEITD